MTAGAGPAGGESGRLARVVVQPVDAAFRDQQTIARRWRLLNFTAEPDFDRARDEYARFLAVVSATGAEVLQLPPGDNTSLDAIYTRDASVVSPRGMVLCRMGKDARAAEPAAQGRAFDTWGIRIAGAIHPPGCLEGGDVAWLDQRTVVVGRGYRTNDDGIRQYRELVGSDVDVIVVPLPHWRGPADVFHLMSILSPVAPDLAVVYAPLLPVPFREQLLARGIRLVEVPDQEFDTMGCNVLALSPRECLMLDGNPVTRERLEAAGAKVHTYDGREISIKGGGGPTCLTRPLVRQR